MDIKEIYEKKYGAFVSLPGYQQEKEYCGRIIQWMKRINLWPVERNTYLDAGCGFGLKTYIFSNHFNCSEGIDFSRNVIEVCKLLNDKPDTLSFSVQEIENCREQKYNLVTAFGLSYFNLDDIEELSSRIANLALKLLEKDGTMLITTRKGPANAPDTGWHNHSGSSIKKIKKQLQHKLAGRHIAIIAPDESMPYLTSGNILQITGSLRKIIFNRPRDLFIIIKNGQEPSN